MFLILGSYCTFNRAIWEIFKTVRLIETVRLITVGLTFELYKKVEKGQLRQLFTPKMRSKNQQDLGMLCNVANSTFEWVKVAKSTYTRVIATRKNKTLRLIETVRLTFSIGSYFLFVLYFLITFLLKWLFFKIFFTFWNKKVVLKR